jgi:uncharacterized protein with HEPN domain
MMDCISNIENDASEGEEAFLSDRRIQDAITRNFEIIGEIVKRLPKPLLATYPEISWSEIAQFRDFLIHHYDRVEPQTLWLIVQNDLQPLKETVRRMISTISQADRSD